VGLLDEILKQATTAGGPRAGAGASAGAGGLGTIAEMLMKNPQIIAAALSMLNPKDASVGGGGGLADVIGAFTKGGLGDVVSSWIGTGANRPVDPGALSSILGPAVLGQFAQRAGIGAAEAPSVLAQVLPELVNQMTPQGQVPQGGALDGVLGSLLGQLGGR
jgi:uncharacterized protein YidB (DUF937 family)